METTVQRLVRRTLKSYSAYVPGTTVETVRRRFGLTRVVKLSSNENPLGTSVRALAALQNLHDLGVYEDRFEPLRERLAGAAGVDVASVVLGHGSNEILQLLFTTFVDPGDDVVMSKPSFSLYRKDARVAAARAIEVPLRDGVHDLDAILAAVTPATKLVLLDDPNNPTGTRLERDALRAFARALAPDVLLVLDQAYREYMDAGACDGVTIMRERPATIVLRTASKIYGLASLRFGYGYTHPEIASWLERIRLPFNVSKPAAAAVLAALDDTGFVTRSIANNDAGRADFEAAFARLGLHVFPSAANFVAVAVPPRAGAEPASADDAYEALLERGIIVRSGDALGLPEYVRVSIGTPEENAAFLDAYAAIAAEWREPAVRSAR